MDGNFGGIRPAALMNENEVASPPMRIWSQLATFPGQLFMLQLLVCTFLCLYNDDDDDDSASRGKNRETKYSRYRYRRYFKVKILVYCF